MKKMGHDHHLSTMCGVADFAALSPDMGMPSSQRLHYGAIFDLKGLTNPSPVGVLSVLGYRRMSASVLFLYNLAVYTISGTASLLGGKGDILANESPRSFYPHYPE